MLGGVPSNQRLVTTRCMGSTHPAPSGVVVEPIAHGTTVAMQQVVARKKLVGWWASGDVWWCAVVVVVYPHTLKSGTGRTCLHLFFHTLSWVWGRMWAPEWGPPTGVASGTMRPSWHQEALISSPRGR